MKHRLFNPITRELANAPVGGHPHVRSIGDPAEWSPPAPWIYIPDLPEPAYDSATQHAPVRSDPTEAGWGWTVTDLTPEEIRARTVPFEVESAQLLLALLTLKEPITEAMILAALANNEAGRIEFQRRRTFHRDHPLVLALAEGFDMTAEQVDQLFITAAQL